MTIPCANYSIYFKRITLTSGQSLWDHTRACSMFDTMEDTKLSQRNFTSIFVFEQVRGKESIGYWKHCEALEAAYRNCKGNSITTKILKYLLIPLRYEKKWPKPTRFDSEWVFFSFFFFEEEEFIGKKLGSHPTPSQGKSSNEASPLTCQFSLPIPCFLKLTKLKQMRESSSQES